MPFLRSALPVAVPRPGSASRFRLATVTMTMALALAGSLTGCASGAYAHHMTTLPRGDDSPGAGAGGPASPPTVADGLLARIPRFDPAPTPEPVHVPAGPSAGWYSAIPTTQRVAFLTIDDGLVKNPEAIKLVQAAHVPITLFLEINAIRDNPDFFRPLQAAGAVIEAHTITHMELKGKSYDVQKREICGSADQLATLYGRRPVLFRPPYGDKDATTLRVVHDCGMTAALFWKETVNTGTVRYQVGQQIAPGDIILMHFRPAFVDDFIAALQAIHDAGLTPARLEDYITT
jgi:peptidoglycan/xylan/chitin deacetylase (PgdA/CDA1 family)